MRKRPNATLTARTMVRASFAMCLVLAGAVISVAGARDVTIRQELEGCPRHAPAHVAQNPWSRARRLLAPHGVQALNLCRYSREPASARRLKLAGNKLVSRRRTIRQLIHKLDALKRYNGPPVHCPRDSGAEVLAFLYYARHRETIVVHLQGCPTASNGDLVRPAYNFDGKNPAGPRLLRQLKRLTYRVHFYV